MAIAIGTLNLKNGVSAITPTIWKGMGIKPQKRPKRIPREIDLRLTERYSLGRLYFSINLSSFPCGLSCFFLKVLRIIVLSSVLLP